MVFKTQVIRTFFVFWVSFVGIVSWLNTEAAGMPPTHSLGSERGVFRIYRYKYSDENTTTVFPERLGKMKGNSSTFMSTFSFDGDLCVKDYGRINGNKVYSLRFVDIRSKHFALNGHDMFDDSSSFAEHLKKNEVFVSLDKNNEIANLHFLPDMPQLYKNFMMTVALEIQVSIKEGKKNWSTQETNQHGTGKVNYKITGKEEDRYRILKTRESYSYPGLIEKDDTQDIQANDKITVNTKGFVEEIDKKEESVITSKDKNETILEVRKTLQLQLKEKGIFDPSKFGGEHFAALQMVNPGEHIPDAGQNRELLAKQAAFLAYHEIENWIKNFKINKKDNRANNSMFYRATGFVELHPKSAEKLAEYAKQKAGTFREKLLVMNVLAAVGTEDAQKAMREILSDPDIRKHKKFGVLVQNFSFMDKKPTSETLTFLQDLMNNHQGFVSYSAAHAFGACIHKLYKGEEKDRALKLNQQLVSKVSTSKTGKDKAEYIAALGNAGMIENNSFLYGYFQYKNPKVRSEAVMALRKTETAESREKLLSVFSDPERSVQRSSIQTFLYFNPEEKNLLNIRDQLDKGLIEEANFYDMTSLLKKNLSVFPKISRECLKIMVRKKLHDPDLEARIRSLIQ